MTIKLWHGAEAKDNVLDLEQSTQLLNHSREEELLP
jgi:hypothetical protein